MRDDKNQPVIKCHSVCGVFECLCVYVCACVCDYYTLYIHKASNSA